MRAALGANRGQLMGLVVGQGLMLALIGVVAGGVAAAVLGRFVETQLYAVQSLDIVSFAVTAGMTLSRLRSSRRSCPRSAPCGFI